MLDERTEMMLQVASELTAGDLDALRGSIPKQKREKPHATVVDEPRARPEPPGPLEEAPAAVQPQSGASSRGAYERQRSRESKVSTGCVGHERTKHQWWSVGTELLGEIGSEAFAAEVIENPQVKSGRSIRITSGSADGEVCITPTRAALRATEAYRQAHNVGRAGGVTNGWTFWKART